MNKILKMSLFSFLLFASVILSAQAYPVILSSFTAEFANDEITIYWTTESEVNNLGWNIYRAEEESIESSEKINATLVLGAGTTTEPTEYEYIDNYGYTYGVTYYYWLESVDYSAQSEFYGPISLDIGTPVFLVSFLVNQGENYSQYATIEWSVQSESNMLHYNLYRSETDLEAAIAVATVEAVNSYEFYTYSHVDDDNITYNTTYYYWLEVVAMNGYTAISAFGEVYIENEPQTSIDNEELKIINLSLSNFPNPFNPITTIQFSSEPFQPNEQITLEIYNIKGQKIRQFEIKNENSKMNEVFWNGEDSSEKPVSSGVYLYKIEGKNARATNKMILIK